ncbi:MAG: DUF1476 domain-containing protein [Sphingobacteriia bacterium]|nr:DUF1476 domain-containing protein [Sphingobacteriia bacterium]
MSFNKNKNELIQEEKFVNEANIEFKINSIRNRLLGEWAANLMHLDKSHTESYIKDVIKSDLEIPGDTDVINKVYEDLQKFGSKLSKAEIKQKVIEFNAQAKKELFNK